jgi:hypothetical protein
MPKEVFPPTENQIKNSIEKFINNIDKAAVCDLASRYNGGKTCRLTKQQHGGFNVCFLVQFEEESAIWVWRIPIAPVVLVE